MEEKTKNKKTLARRIKLLICIKQTQREITQTMKIGQTWKDNGESSLKKKCEEFLTIMIGDQLNIL